MDLLQNPFHILSASPRDNRRRIMELADERSLLLDSSECMEARSDLTSPRKRLSAEVAWLPGLGPKRAREVLSILESSPGDLLTIDKLSSIAKTNLLAAGLSRLHDYSSNVVAEWILEISWAFEDIEEEKILTMINEERTVSGFPEVTDMSAVEFEIQERRRHYRQVIKSALDNLPSKKLVETVTNAVESATDAGEEHGPILIADLVDSYEVEAQGFLDREEGNIRSLVEKLLAEVNAERPDSVLSPMVNKLIHVVKNWDTVAQPIQVSAKSRGLDHGASQRVAGMVRDLAIHMFNKHGKLDFSRQIMSMLQEVFAEVGEVAERTSEDADALDEIHENLKLRNQQAEEDNKKWEKETSYRVVISFSHFSREEFSISPKGIAWTGRTYSLESITRIRWGFVQDGRNTLYSIYFGDKNNIGNVRTLNEKVYLVIIEKLWRAVGVRLLIEMVENFKSGKCYTFGSAVVEDEGVHLIKRRLFGANERFFGDWSKVKISNTDGFFSLEINKPKKVAEKLSYLEIDNLHVLDAAIRTVLNKGYSKLSNLL